MAGGRAPVPFGPSIGGFVALWAAQHVAPVGGVIATTLVDLRPGDGGRDRTLPLARRDPLVGRRRVSGRFPRTAFDYRPRWPDVRIDCPLLLVHPGADAWTPAALSTAVLDRVPARRRLVELDGGAHAPLERPAYDQACAAAIAFLREAGDGADAHGGDR